MWTKVRRGKMFGMGDDAALWRANPDWWTHAGVHLPWLRSQRLHVVTAGCEDEVQRALEAAGYTCLILDGTEIRSGKALMESTKPLLRLWEHFWPGWDSWRDCLRDLNDIWADKDRVALLWLRSDVLATENLQDWFLATLLLEEASQFLGTKPTLMAGQKVHPRVVPHRLMVFETFCFVDGFGAQRPEESS